MATLSTLNNLINNAKQTPSGLVEWSDTSLKGIQEEVMNLFQSNAFQLAANVVNLQTLSNANSNLAVVEADSDVTRNGMYFWNAAQLVVGFNYPASGGGYWNLIKNSTTAPVTQIVAGSNITVSPSGGTGVVTISAPTPTSINPTDKFIPYRIGSTSFGDSPIKWDTTVFPQLSTVYTGITKGLFFDFSIDQYILGKSSNQIELNGNNMTTTVNSILQGFYFNTSSDTFLLGGGFSGGGNSTLAIGVWQPNTPANSSMFIGSALTVAANASTASGRKIKVFIPTVGYKYIQLYDN